MARLVASPIRTPADSTFADDLLGREAFARALTRLIAGQRGPLLLALDAPWGEGKTTFVHMWRHLLAEQGIDAVYLDAFAHDDADDPFLPLVGELLAFAGGPGRGLGAERLEPVTGAAARVGARLLGFGARTFLRDAREAAGAASLARDIIAEQLSDFASRASDVDAFKAELGRLARALRGDGETPLIYVVDELDRCRPDFAVSLLDRIGHLFDVPDAVFLLVVHRAQLEESIRCAYGAGIDAGEYVSKFVHVWCSLPLQPAEGVDDQYLRYCQALFDAHELGAVEDEATLRKVLPYICRVASLSLRQMERVFSNLAVYYSTLTSGAARMPALACVVAVLRVRDFATFRMLRDQSLSFGELRGRAGWLFRRTEASEWIVGDLVPWLEYCLTPALEFSSWSEERKERSGRSLARHGVKREEILPRLCAQFEMFRAG